MKKWIAFIFALVCVIGLIGCKSNQDVPFDETGAFFVAKVVEIKGTTLLVEVTDKGNCGASVGDAVVVSAEQIADVLANNPSIVTDNYVRVEFSGEILESYPLQLAKVFKIDIIDAEGKPAA